MATKTKKAAPSKKESVKESVSHAKSEKKGGKAAAKAAAAAPAALEGAPVVSADELEELEEAAAESASNGGGGNAAALAAASGATEMSASFKNFRHHPDMENFYRFIYENDLRHEALAIIDTIALEKQNRRLLKTAKAQAH